MIKQLLYLFSAAALLSACQKGGEELPVPGSAGELSFNLSVDGIQVTDTKTATRAAGVDTDLKTSGFYLAGYHTEGLIDTKAATAVPNVFDKEDDDQQLPVPLVKFEGNKFTLKTIKWELDGVSYLSFFGWSQNKAFPTSVTTSTTGIIKQTFNASDKGYPWLEVRNADAPADQTDVVGSRSIDHKNDAVLSAVDLDFRHLLSKFTFKAKSSSGAKVTITAANIKYVTDKVYKKARYTFGSGVGEIGAWGSYAERQSGTVALNSTSSTITGSNTATIGSLLLIPQALEAGDVSLVLKYKISPNGTIDGPEQTKTLPLSAITPEQGKNYAYSIDIQATDITFMGNPIVEPWNLASTSTLLPIIHGPRDGKTLLLLDGYDKPYQHTDGKWYWLDRSGYNRHVELTAGYTSYDAANHAYVFTNTAKGGIIPDLGTGTVSAITFDLIAESTITSSNFSVQMPFSVGSFVLQAPYSSSNRVDWNFPGNFISWNAPLFSDVIKRTYWTTTATASSSNIYYNADLKKSSNTGMSSSAMSSGYLANTYKGSIFYFRVTEEELSQMDIIANYEECVPRFGLTKPTLRGWTTQPANSYYCNTTDNGLQFDASKKPRTKSGVMGTDVLNLYYKDIKPEKVEILWQTAVNHGTTGGTGNMTIQSIEYKPSSGLCNVYTRGAGNAYLVGKDVNGKIIWGWHIWVTDGAITNSSAINGVTFMDRNLGALAATTSQPAAEDAYKYFGMIYQWGRKETFTGQGTGTAVNTYTKIFNASGMEISGGVGGFTCDGSGATSMTDCVQNPLKFYSTSDYGVISGHPNTWNPVTKSIYDPCPYGYRVTPNGSFRGFPSFSLSGSQVYYGTVWNGSWWGLAGRRNNNNGAIDYVGAYSYQWTSTQNSATKAYDLLFSRDNYTIHDASTEKASGISIRCVVE